MSKHVFTVICVILCICLVAGGIYFYMDHQNYAKQIETLTTTSADQAAQVETLTATSADQAAQIETLTAANTDHAAQIETLTAANTDQAAQIETLTATTTDQAAQIETLTATTTDQAAQIETLTATNTDQAAQIETLTAAAASNTTTEDLSGVAETTLYTSTKRLIAQLKEHDINYTYSSNSSNEDVLTINLTATSDDGTKFSYTEKVFFQSEDLMGIYVWNFIDFDSSSLTSVKVACNSLNASWRWPTFYVESSSSSISASQSVKLADSPAMGDLMYDYLVGVDSILRDAYDDLVIYAK